MNNIDNLHPIVKELLNLRGITSNEDIFDFFFQDIYSLSNPFNIKDVHPHDTATIISSCGVCVRAGDHCAQPLIRFLNLPATCRASMYIYNTKADIDRLIMALNKANDMFKKWRKVKK